MIDTDVIKRFEEKFVIRDGLNEDLWDNIEDFIEEELSKAREETEKAYGGCHKCYGKGYSTYIHGERLSADFEGDKDIVTKQKVHMVYCTCDRGKQLEILVNEAREEGKREEWNDITKQIIQLRNETHGYLEFETKLFEFIRKENES